MPARAAEVLAVVGRTIEQVEAALGQPENRVNFPSGNIWGRLLLLKVRGSRTVIFGDLIRQTRKKLRVTQRDLPARGAYWEAFSVSAMSQECGTLKDVREPG